jgi:glutamate dehydrogenase (NAD(P)+)|tara:strand:+ start:31820 stop:32854 length:1035 start_codon:yes stop_codon:yes gene_type:complete
VGLRKLSSANAFVVTDLVDVPSFGIVRSAKKILQGGAKDLARSMTYTFASFEMEKGGASGGINATPDEKEEAIGSFVSELTDDVSSGNLGLDAGKGITPSSFEKLTAVDSRSDIRFSQHGSDDLGTFLTALGPIVVAEQLDGLDGKTVSIEGFGGHSPAMMDLIAERGGTVVAISTLSGSVSDAAGLDASEIRSQWEERGIDFVKSVDGEAEPAWKVFQSGADVLFAGSKMGAVSHVTAEKLQVDALIPHQPIPFTARALAMLQRKGATVAPDFLAVAGPIFASWPNEGESVSDIIATATSSISSALVESSNHEDGLFLGACYRAESFLSSWHDTKLFGRPLAS